MSGPSGSCQEWAPPNVVLFERTGLPPTVTDATQVARLGLQHLECRAGRRACPMLPVWMARYNGAVRRAGAPRGPEEVAVGRIGRQADEEVVGYRFRDCPECDGRPSLHPVRHIQHGKLAACVDVEVGDLVLACWQAGIATTESCQSYQDQPGGPPAPPGTELVLLSLPMADAERFANALLHSGDRALHQRMFGVDAPDGWELPMLIPGEEVFWPGREIRLAFAVAYVFPRAEVPLLTGRLHAWRYRRGAAVKGE
jgi:hypothetical protein